MGVNTYPEIKYGKIYKVRTRIAYYVKGYIGSFRVFSRKVVRYVTRWRDNEDSYLISEGCNVIDTNFIKLPVLDLKVIRDEGEGIEPLFTDIEEMKDWELFVHRNFGVLLIRPKDVNNPNICPLLSFVEQVPYCTNFQYYFGVHIPIHGFGVLRLDGNEGKVHFDSNISEFNDTIRCSVLVDKDCNIWTTLNIGR